MQNENPFARLLNRRGGDPDLQAGSKGLSPCDSARLFFSTGRVLELLRTMSAFDIEVVAAATLVAAERIRAYEADTDHPTPQDTAALGRFYDADLSVLLRVLGACSERSGI